jgi:amidohydrolase
MPALISKAPRTLLRLQIAAGLLLAAAAALAQNSDGELEKRLQSRIEALQPKDIASRRDIHAQPEHSGQEINTARRVADHLRALGLEVKTGVAGTGVVGLLKGDSTCAVVALRADMDALPVEENTGLPFASRVKTLYQGDLVPVAHACGHDGHTAILMGVAELLAGMKSDIRGSVKFIFQPAEEGLPQSPGGASWGARAMIEQGVLQQPQVDAIFGLHLAASLPVGSVGYRSGPLMAGADAVRISVKGAGAHAAMPWAGVDPIPVAAHIVTALQTVVSRQLDITREPAVLTIGAIHGGQRDNVISDSVEMAGTLRTFDEDMRADAKRRIERTAQSIAAASGAQARVTFGPTAYGVTHNPPALVEAVLPTLRRATGGQVVALPRIPASEDFSEFQRVVPGFYFILGATPADRTPATAAPNHAPGFDFNEQALAVGMRTLALLALDQLAQRAGQATPASP